VPKQVGSVTTFAYSGGCRTLIPISVGQRSDSFRTVFRADVGQFWGAIGMVYDRIGTVSDKDRNPGPEGVERRWNGCQGSRSIQMNRERQLDHTKKFLDIGEHLIVSTVADVSYERIYVIRDGSNLENQALHPRNHHWQSKHCRVCGL
jgi:hypothetical protein